MIHLKNKLIFYFTGFLFFSFISFGQTRNLDDYLNLAVSSNPALKENIGLQQITDLQNELISAQFKYPQLSITADYLFAPYFFNNGQFISVTPTPDASAYGYDPATTNGGLYSAQLNLSLPLFSGFQSDPLIKQNAIQKKSLSQSNQQLLHDLKKDVTAQYISLYVAGQQLVFFEHIMKILDDRKTIASALVQKGILPQTDFLQLQIEYNSMKYNQQIQTQQVKDALTQLNNLCGTSDTNYYKLKLPELQLTSLKTEFRAKEKFQTDSLNLVMQQEINETKYLPQLSVFGNTGLNATQTSTLSHNIGLSAGLHFAIPLYDGNQKSVTRQQTSVQIENLSRNYHSQIQIQINTLSSQLTQIKMIEESLKLLDLQLKDQENLLELLKDKVATGQVSVTDYTVSLQNYIQTSQNRLQTQLTYWQLINQYNYLNW